MHFGTLSSSILHTVLIVWVIFTGLARPIENEPLEFTKVTLVSEEEFARLGTPQEGEKEAPNPEEEPSDEPPLDVEISAPTLKELPENAAPVLVIDKGAPKPIKRVAPIPVAPPEPDIQRGNKLQDEITPEVKKNVDDEREQRLAEVPEEATTQTITEAVETGKSLAPEVSALPRRRPEKPVEKPKAPRVQRERVSLSEGAKDKFRREIGLCWNINALSSEAQRVTITVIFSLNREARPHRDTIELIASNGGSEKAAFNAFGVAKRAIIRCGDKGFDLPLDKYQQWRNIELVFNPNLMRLR